MSKKFLVVFFLVFLVSYTQANKQATIKKHWIPGIGRVTVTGSGSYKVSVDGIQGGPKSPKLGTRQNPAPSCKAILDNDWSARSGPYYIKTNPSVTKVFCYMEGIPGCGGGGWTTIIKTNGHKTTFRYESAFWSNKLPYRVDSGQSGTDERETKLPTYWTLPFTSLCLGMKTNIKQQPNWIHVNYKASSLYSVIADGKYRRLNVGRSQWKSLIAGSSLQKNCNREGFNSFPQSKVYKSRLARVRIGIVSNQENECKSPDSRIGFGGNGDVCGVGKINTGNCARHRGDNGDKTIVTYGYVLAQ